MRNHRVIGGQGGFVVITVALLMASIVFGYLVTMYGSAVHARKLDKITFARGAVQRVAAQAMANYSANHALIESDGADRDAWLASPEHWLAGVNEPALTGRVGIAINPVRQYGGDDTSPQGQYYAFTRAVAYVLDDASEAQTTRPAFNAEGELVPCGSYEASVCPHQHQMAEVPIAAFQADRLAEAVRQVRLMASRLESYFNLQVHLDPLHEMGVNHFRDKYCVDPGSGQNVPFGRLPCLTGFERVADASLNARMDVLLLRAGFSNAALDEYRYPWPKLGTSIEIELANQEGNIQGSALKNSESYPYTMAVRQLLPWPARDGSPLYVVAYALQQ